jgi:hypothetical protein
MKKIIPFLLFFYVGNSMAEITLLCIAEKSVGFDYENGTWSYQRYIANEKYLYKGDLALDKYWDTDSIGTWSNFGEKPLVSQNCHSKTLYHIECFTGSGTITISKENFRFAQAYHWGYLREKNFIEENRMPDDIYLSIGKCSKL